MRTRKNPLWSAVAMSALGLLTIPSQIFAQDDDNDRPRRGFGPGGPRVVSPDVAEDGSVTFRILAEAAEEVDLISSDIPGDNRGRNLTRGENDVWEVTVGPLDPGAYRYQFQVDEVPVIDSRNTDTSESNNTIWSLVYVPGSEFMDARDVPHGAVAEVTYHSKSLDRFRRMHVYTPPGYESGDESYPVFYLLHGASDSDDSWTTVGRAGFILDNLIADGKAKPMIMVMPAGHTGPFMFGRRGGDGPPVDEFQEDFSKDVVPHIESNYRVKDGRENRAIAGLSMGGMQTLNAAFNDLDRFGYVGVFSSGVFGINGGFGGGDSGPSWEEQHTEVLSDADSTNGLKLFWFATGSDDFLVETSRATVEMFKGHEFAVVYSETDGGHTWNKWREYLNEFAPQLFQ